MATTVVKTIGTGGDYSTLQAWEDACPSNLVTADQIWQGQVNNQVFSGTTNLLTISGTTVDATRYVELTTVAGSSWSDNANVRTNALRYNEANGAAIKITATYANAVVVNQSYTRISKIQFSSTGTSSGYMAPLSVNPEGTSDYCDIDRCIFEASNSNNVSGFSALTMWGQNTKVRRSLILTKTASTTGYIAYFYYGASAYNCVFASLNATLTTGIYNKYFTPVMQNCAVMNVTSLFSGGAAWTLITNKTDAASPPAGFTSAAYSSVTFANITDGTHDFRTVTGSALINAGTTDAANAPTDVTGQAWSGGTDIGLWDFSAAGASAIFTSTTANASFAGNAKVSPKSLFSVTAANTTFSGNASANPKGLISVTTAGASFNGSASGSLTSGTITTEAFKNNTGTVLNGLTVAKVWAIPLTAPTFSNVVTDGNGVLSVSGSGMVAGTEYLLISSDVAGATVGVKKYTAT